MIWFGWETNVSQSFTGDDFLKPPMIGSRNDRKLRFDQSESNMEVKPHLKTWGYTSMS